MRVKRKVLPAKSKAVSVKPGYSADGSAEYEITVNADAFKRAGKEGVKDVAGAISAVAHAPLSIAGPILAPTGYERKDFQPTVSAERWIGVGAGLAVGTLVCMFNGMEFAKAALIGGTLGSFGGAGAVTVGHKLSGWKPILLDKIALAKGKGAETTSGSPARKAGAALRMGYDAGFAESWKRGEEGAEKLGEIAQGAAQNGNDFLDGFLHPGT